MKTSVEPRCSEPVARALATGTAVVALESTIITHGMPFPANLETARQAEQAVRAQGATPATIAVLDGEVCIGMSAAQLERLASSAGAAGKCSLRDLSLMTALGAARTGRSGTAGTTVAATLHLAHGAGIRVFATGGIGGVHRGAAASMDVSADLPALAALPLVTVCSGPKAILDLALTLEVLETLGVPVLAYGTDRLPAFWSRDSDHGVDARVDRASDVAAVLDAQRALGLRSGVLLCNPVPEAHALPAAAIAAPIEAALADAAAQGISGKALTPYLLDRVVTATGGDSLRTNQALMVANARLAAEVALALAGAPAA